MENISCKVAALIILISNLKLMRFDYLAIAFGAVIGPVTMQFAPDADLLVAGLVGGTLAFFLARPKRRGGQ